ncbi:hypothetical protein ACFL0S_01600 [Thermodesulfobacteriota bacterium]
MRQNHLQNKSCWLSANAKLLYALIALLLIPLWTTQFVPTQDGPLHIASAVTLVNYQNTGYETARQYYELNDQIFLFPTWLVSLNIGWLSGVFSALIAEKIVLTLFIIGLPLAFCFAIRPLTDSPQLGGLLVLPLVYNYLLHMGFYAFLLGLVMLFILIGIWLRSQQQSTISITIAACLASYFTFHVHPFAWVMMALALGCIELFYYFSKLRSQSNWAGRFATVGQVFLKRWHLYLLTIAPGMLHTLVFLTMQGSTTGSFASKVSERLGTTNAAVAFAAKRFDMLIDRIVGLASLSSLVSFSYVEMVLSFGVMSSLILLTFLTLRSTARASEWSPRLCFLMLSLCYIVFYLLAKNSMAGGGFIPPRVQLLALLSYIAWLASSSALPRFRVLVRILSVVLVGLSVLYYTFRYQEFSHALDREVSLAIHMKEGTTVMPVVLPDSVRIPVILDHLTPNPMLHASGHFVYRRNMVDLSNIKGWRGYFPLRFRPDYNPMRHIAVNGKIELSKNKRLPDLVLDGHGDGNVFVDYVVVVGLIDNYNEYPEIDNLIAQLERSYNIVSRKPGVPPVTLFRHKESDPP